MYSCRLSAESRAVVITVVSLEMFVTYKAAHSQRSHTVTPCFTDVALLQASCAGAHTKLFANAQASHWVREAMYTCHRWQALYYYTQW
jgi:hypothetical protein